MIRSGDPFQRRITNNDRYGELLKQVFDKKFMKILKNGGEYFKGIRGIFAQFNGFPSAIT